MPPSQVRFPIGTSDFRNLRADGFQFVDKSPFVEAVLTASAQVMLVPRPRRFGKTLNLSMFRYFVEKSSEDRRSLFEGLAVASSERARPHFQRYPVIFLTFKDLKPASWEECLAGLGDVLAEIYGEHSYLLKEGALDSVDARLFTDIHERRAPKTQLVTALKLLSRLLAQYHRERVVILIDEYDSPIHAGYAHRYYDDIIAFFRDFLSGGLKDNEHLFKGVLTGILRVAKESLFSGLNNIDVYSLLRSELSTFFGFTESEVQALVETTGKPELVDGMRAFYNGYLFGGHAIYNPWSVLCFLDRADHVLRPYWIGTSSNELVRHLLIAGPHGARAELEALLAGGAIEKNIDENIVLRDIDRRSDAVWSFLLFTGYLKAVEVRYERTELMARLAIPNEEVAGEIRAMIRDWLRAQVGGSDELKALLEAILRGDAPVVEEHLGQMMKVNLSFFDAASPQPERFYHGLVVGLLAGLTEHEVRSNRESGLGRCDVMILPRTAGQPGVVLELKLADKKAGETKEKAIASALRQIRARDYAAELRARGAAPIHEMAAVFEGKRVHVRAAADVKKTRRKAAAKVAKRAVPKPKARGKKVTSARGRDPLSRRV